MKREKKYYVSTTDGVTYNGIRRLTKYFATRTEAESEFNRLRVHYDMLFLRMLLPDNKTRKTLKTA